jgi:hypothetical protein
VESQHPSGHVEELHVAPWHTPPTHASPATHAAHAAPPVPQSFNDVPSWHTPVESQQPVGQVVALHAEALQIPPLHVSPGGHDRHALPPVPHAPVLVPVSQKPSLSQQPMGQLAALQVVPVHAPAVHESPGGHGTHESPPLPHAEVLVPDSHFPKLSQHPVPQLTGLQVTPKQAPMKHASPGGHAVHATPPLPHAVELLPVWQTPVESQQPVGHVDALHVVTLHAPPLQLSPTGHDVQALPPVPHAVVLVPDSQKPRASQHPFGQVAGLHEGPLQTPAAQVSPGGHGKQAPPPVPHAMVVIPDSQTPRASQQPVGHVMALQVLP